MTGLQVRSNATGSVIERVTSRGRVYAIRFRAGGERRYQTVGYESDGATRRDAEALLAETLERVRDGVWQPPGTAQGYADLLDVFRAEHEACYADLRSALDHACNAGEVLLEVRNRLPHGTWTDWLQQSLAGDGPGACSVRTAVMYMRFARNRDQLAQRGIATRTQAEEFLRGTADGRIDGGVCDQARQMAADGIPTRQIAKSLGVSRSTVGRYLNPESAERWKRQRHERNVKARMALRQRERQATVRRVNGAAARGYALMRQALQALDQAVDEHEGEVRRDLNAAIAAMHRAEDAVVAAARKASGESRKAPA